MGGHAAGEIASELVSTTVAEALARACDQGVPGDALLAVLQEASRSAHRAIVQCCEGDLNCRGMGTTLTACVLDTSGRCWIGHIGDSRLYRLREGKLEQLTRDHTWVQREIDAGRLAPDAARKHPLSHIITRVLSEDSDPQMDLHAETVTAGDMLLLATDGLYNMIDHLAITEMLSEPRPLAEITARLIRSANRAGGVDNITVVLVQILAGVNPDV
jgi:PPM family protein phosphatase